MENNIYDWRNTKEYYEWQAKNARDLHISIGKVTLALTELKKNGTVKFGTTKYDYMQLPDLLIDKVREVLGNEGLSLKIVNKHTCESTVVKGTTDVYITNGVAEHPIVEGYYVSQLNTDPIKASGAISTYVRKYAYAQLLHIAADDNDPDQIVRDTTPVKPTTPKVVKEEPTTEIKPFKSSITKNNESDPFF